LYTIDATKVGNYTATLEASLAKYTLAKPVKVAFDVIILPKTSNNLPYFNPKLQGSVKIVKTKDPTDWTFRLN